MPRVKMTATSIPRADPGQRARVEYEDEHLPGLFLRVGPTNIRTWCVRCRVRGRQIRVNLGRYPVILLADARQRALDAQRAAERGADPRRGGGPVTLEALTREYIDAHPTLAVSTQQNYEAWLDGYVRLAPVARTPVDRLTLAELRGYRADLRGWLKEIAEATPVAANRVHQLVSAVLAWAEEEHLIDRDPSAGLAKPAKERARERVLSDDEVRVFWRMAGEEGPEVGALLRLYLLLGQRYDETARARWEDVDAENRLWSIPGTSRKGDRFHVVPLPGLAIEVLEPLRAATGGAARLFPNVSPTNRGKWFAPVRARMVAAGVGAFTQLDLRRTCATGMARLGHARFVVGLVLGHVTSGTGGGGSSATPVYERYDRLPERRAALEAWAEHVRALSGGPPPRA